MSFFFAKGLRADAAPRMPLICLSHLRWDFVFQRPQHLMTRLATRYRVIFWEEPEDGEGPRLQRAARGEIEVATPILPPDCIGDARDRALTQLLAALADELGAPPVLWHYTPTALGFSRNLGAAARIYDCMDDLAGFKGASADLGVREEELLLRADTVFAGGRSLFEARRDRHDDIHLLPSAVDVAHFAQARLAPPCEGAPVLGYFGVIDERMDLDLVAQVAAARPDWRIEMIGPVAKIDPASLPQAPNLHWLGAMDYAALPQAIAHWRVALMPFALNEATRSISPTKTPEYLAAGKPVVSTAIADVVRDYGDLTGVLIADDAEGFIAACDAAAQLLPEDWRSQADDALATLSWDATAATMAALIDRAVARRGVTTSEARPQFDYLVVGAGFAGAVMAERLAADADARVLVIDKRPHIAGNAYDHHDAAGILVHRYGPHIFHTNSPEVFAYLSRFTRWRPYEHRVLAEVGGQLVPMPINRTTLNRLYDLALVSEDDVEAYLARVAEPIATVRTSEDVVVGRVGRDLYKRFFRGYTRKQWGLDPSELDKSVTARVPTRASTDDRYFTDSHQAMPAEGYTRMFAAMLRHPNIEVRLDTDFESVRDEVDYDQLIWTGPIDEYFGHRFGRLPYRSLRFAHETHDREQFQPVATVNYPAEDVPYTRITEYKHLTGQNAPRTSITYEYPTAEGDPYYPIPRAENQALFKRYEALADAEPNVTFVGRLATYRYYNMDQVVGQALAAYRRLRERQRAAEPLAVSA